MTVLRKSEINSLLASVKRSPLFSATAVPYLLLDRNLTIRSANEAYLGATGRVLDELMGKYVFDAFPDNPRDPAADGVRNLNASLESVLRSAQRSYMWVQRYDVPGPSPGDEFILKYWSPVNSPIRDDRGHTAGVLHHVEDVTSVWVPAAPDGDPAPAAGTVDRNSLTTQAGTVALLHNEEAYARLAAEVTQLRRALISRIMIEQAKGIIMAERRCGPQDAFEILRNISRSTHTKLRDLARALIEETQRLPATHR